MNTVTISRWGNSLALRIPKGVVAEEGLKEGDTLCIERRGGEIALKKVRTIKHYALEDVIKNFHTCQEIREQEWGTPQGQEVW